MTNTIKKTYHWKTLTEDGLLKEHKTLGHDCFSLNDWGYGFDSEEEAQAKLLELTMSYYSDELDSNLVLVTVYNVVED